jgi:hypothetical protein
MVKIEVTFTPSGDIQTINLLDGTDLSTWVITLLPIRQKIELDLTWMFDESVARIKHFAVNQVSWYKNIVPYIILDSVFDPDALLAYEHRSDKMDGKNHVCIYDVIKQQLRILPAKLTLPVQELKFGRYKTIAYNNMIQYLRQEFLVRSFFLNQQSILESQKRLFDEQKLVMETMNGLVAQSMSEKPERSERSLARPYSPTIRRPPQRSLSKIDIDQEQNFWDSKSVTTPPLLQSGALAPYSAVGNSPPSSTRVVYPDWVTPPSPIRASSCSVSVLPSNAPKLRGGAQVTETETPHEDINAVIQSYMQANTKPHKVV